MIIRKLQPEDAHSFRQLRLKALRDHPDAFGASYEDWRDLPIESVKERLESSDSRFILAAFTDNGELAGMVGFSRETSRKTRHKGVVWGMYVDSAYRGQGIGRRLLAELIRLAESLPEIEQLHLAVVHSNVPARRLYESFGFVTFGTEVHALKLDDETYYDEDWMVKKLRR
jgi:ribosomal protein S18 acetylase RimI-like enzyme